MSRARRQPGGHHRRVHRPQMHGRRWSDCTKPSKSGRPQSRQRTRRCTIVQNTVFKKAGGMTGTADEPTWKITSCAWSRSDQLARRATAQHRLPHGAREVERDRRRIEIVNKGCGGRETPRATSYRRCNRGSRCWSARPRSRVGRGRAVKARGIRHGANAATTSEASIVARGEARGRGDQRPAAGPTSSWAAASMAPEKALPKPVWSRATRALAEIDVIHNACASASRSSRGARLGGLYVLSTERHEARHIDNQLRGRSGRQERRPLALPSSKTTDASLIAMGQNHEARRRGPKSGAHGLAREKAQKRSRTTTSGAQVVARIRRRDGPAAQDDLRCARACSNPGCASAPKSSSPRPSRARPRPTSATSTASPVGSSAPSASRLRASRCWRRSRRNPTSRRRCSRSGRSTRSARSRWAPS